MSKFFVEFGCRKLILSKKFAHAFVDRLSRDSAQPTANREDPPVVRNKFHEFVSSKPEWYEICDSAKQFSEHPS